jgi:hypothetical protein
MPTLNQQTKQQQEKKSQGNALLSIRFASWLNSYRFGHAPNLAERTGRRRLCD